MENNFAYSSSVTQDNRFCDPRDPRKQIACVAVEDVGKCAADILRNPEPHYNKTYKLVSQKFSMIDLTISMSKVLRRRIKVKETTWVSFKQSLLQNKVPEWQIDGLVEWLESNVDRRIMEPDLMTIEKITGERPSNIDHFIATNAPQFGWSLK
jgi:uncharacterized protein YbjT (DUF2867 family)